MAEPGTPKEQPGKASKPTGKPSGEAAGRGPEPRRSTLPGLGGPVTTLTDAVNTAHESIREMLLRASRSETGSHESHRGFRPADQLLATASRHIAAIEDVIAPAARKTLDNGSQQVAELLLRSRSLERTLHQIKGSYSGSAQAQGIPRDELWADATAQIDSQMAEERTLVARLQERLSPEEGKRVLGAFADAFERGPTFPHPHTPRKGALGRVSHRFVATVDRVRDSAVGRIVPVPKRLPNPKRNSIFSRYLRGAPTIQTQPGDTSVETVDGTEGEGPSTPSAKPEGRSGA